MTSVGHVFKHLANNYGEMLAYVKTNEKKPLFRDIQIHSHIDDWLLFCGGGYKTKKLLKMANVGKSADSVL